MGTNAIERWPNHRSDRFELSGKALCALATVVVACVVMAGCQEPTLPDPNDPESFGEAPPSLLMRNLEDDYVFFAERVRRGEITSDQAQGYLAAEADEMVRGIDLRKIPASEAWQYGDVFRTAERWDLAKIAYGAAVKSAKTEDRLVNDTLRLALCMVHLGQIKEGIETARTIFGASRRESAPILPAVLLEIVPAAQGKGYDGELARLLEDAVKKHEETVVNANERAGRAFILAKGYHIMHAWQKVAELYRSIGRRDLAQAAEKRAAAVTPARIPGYVPRRR